MNVPPLVQSLIERYTREEHILQSAAYGEADLRKEFVEPLFTALGWDVANVSQHAETYKDVINEYSLRIGDTHKAPDYAFRVGGNRIFFVEAKRPGVDITVDPAPAYQLRRYGWTAKLPISILVNFRHLAIYDCGRRPKESDRPAVARTLLIPWRQLADRWNELASLVGKTAVYQGSLDRYTTDAGRRRGTSLVDDAFLEQMEQWRSDLASNIALRNNQLIIEELNECVQQTIDRLVFLRIAEDRGIEPYGSLRDATHGSGVYAKLLAIFKAADVRYNSGLFHFRTERGISGKPDQLTPNIHIDDRILRAVINGMYYPTSPYEFSVFSADILGQVYEQFLGKVITLTPSHRAHVEAKPEVKRAGGVYYTPTWVVEHIVARTLAPALKAKSPTSALKLRVLDPACGSGTFLIGAYSYLLEWFAEQYKGTDETFRRKHMYLDHRDEWRLTLAERKRILLACIYGVDIDPQAIEVSKLSLMLKLLEDQSIETINRQVRLFHIERILPDLDRNIQCGNSLVGSEVTRVLDITSDDEALLNPFDWNFGFPAVMRGGGFDVVIGNPPYDVLEKQRGAASWPHALLRDYLPHASAYEPALGGKLNLYRLFLVRSISLTKSNGRFGMIMPLSLVADISTAATRRFALRSLSDAVFDCFPQKDNPAGRVFRRAKLSTVIVTGLRGRRELPATNPVTTRVYPANDLADPFVENEVTLKECAQLDPANLPLPLTDRDEWKLCQRIYAGPNIRRLGDLGDSYRVTRGEINQTIYRRYIRSTPDGHAPLLKGVEVGALELHSSLSQGQREWIDEEALLADQPNKSRPQACRIATQRITGVDERQRLVAALVGRGHWFADSTNSIAAVSEASLSLEYLLCLLNSDLLQWRFRMTSTNNNVGTNELLCLPIRVPDPADSSEVSAFRSVCAAGERIRELKALRPKHSSTTSLELYARRLKAALLHLNECVANLYGLSADERNLVERSLAQTPVSTLTGNEDD